MDNIFFLGRRGPRAQTLIGQRMGLILGMIVVPMWKIVQNVRANSKERAAREARAFAARRRMRVPRPVVRERRCTPVQEQPMTYEAGFPVTPVRVNQPEAFSPLTSLRKRDYEEDLDCSSCPGTCMMSASKRRNLDIPPPRSWRESSWFLEHRKAIETEEHSSIILPTPSPSPPLNPSAQKSQLRNKSLSGTRPNRDRYRISKPKKIPVFRLTRDCADRYPFLWTDSDSEGSLSPSPSPEPEIRETSEIHDVTMQDASPIKHSIIEQQITHSAQAPAATQSTLPGDAQLTDAEDSTWDDEEDTEWRLFMRDLPESINDNGYKVPILGIVSPKTRVWNAEHRQKLILEAIAQNVSPSQVPYAPLETPPASPTRSRSKSAAKTATPPARFTEPITPHTAQHDPQLAQAEQETQPENRTSFLSSVISKLKMPIEWLSPRRSTTSQIPDPVKESQDGAGDDQENLKEHAYVAEDTEAPGDQMDVTRDDKPQFEDVKFDTDQGTDHQNKLENATTGADTIQLVQTGKDITPTQDVKHMEESPLTDSEDAISIGTPNNPNTHTPKTPQLSPSKASKKQMREPFKTPEAQLQKLSLGPLTAKSQAWSVVRTERITRRQHKIVAQEALKDKYKLVPLGGEWIDKVKATVKSGVKDKYTSTDLSRVVPEFAATRGHDNWLNDVVINDYLTLIVQHGNQDDRPTQVPSHAAFTSHAWTKIAKDPKSLPTKWAKKQKIQGKAMMDCEKIFFPMCSGAHWTLAVAEPTQRRVTVYNSMGSSRAEWVARQILQYIKHEVGATFNEDEWTMGDAGQSPQQNNSDDCGVFTITNARQIMLGQMEKAPYDASIIPLQRQRIVAELVHGGLLSDKMSVVHPDKAAEMANKKRN